MILLYTEILKTRRKKLPVLILSLTLTELLWGLWAFSNSSNQELAQGWKCIVYQFTILNCIILPVSIAVLASRICSIEHPGNALRLIKSLMPSSKIFDIKFLYSSLYIMLILIIQISFMIILGNLKHFEDAFSMRIFVYYFIFNMLVSLTILALQQTLSLIFENQIISVSVGLLGSFLGLFSLFLSNGLNKLIIWAYYGILLLVHMDWTPADRSVIYYYAPLDWQNIFLLLFIFLVTYSGGKALFIRKDV